MPAALAEARGRGWRLAILSNSDRDLIAASKQRLGVPFDETVVAGEIGSYKPALGHWREFEARTGADPRRHVHVAPSRFHDIGPATELGLPSSGSTGWASAATRRRRGSCPIWPACRTRSTSSCRTRLPVKRSP